MTKLFKCIECEGRLQRKHVGAVAGELSTHCNTAFKEHALQAHSGVVRHTDTLLTTPDLTSTTCQPNTQSMLARQEHTVQDDWPLCQMLHTIYCIVVSETATTNSEEGLEPHLEPLCSLGKQHDI